MTDSGVCVVTHPLSAAGENATRTLLDILAALGPVSLITADLPPESSIYDDHDVVLLTPEGAGNDPLTAAFRFSVNQVRMCRQIVRRDEPVVLFFGATAYLLPILFASFIGKTVLVEPRGDVPLTLRLKWERRMPDLLARYLAGSVRILERVGFLVADRIVTYTPSMAEELDLDPDAQNVYPHGARYVDTEGFSIQTPFRERENVIGFVGRIDEEKGIRDLAEVAKRLPEDITFRFVGGGPLLEWLSAELAPQIERGTVEVAGWVDHAEVARELNRMKLLVLPSHPTEGLPTIILEAMACGTPVYATPVAGVPDVVREDETGFLLTAREPEVIVDHLQKLLERDDLAAISATAREHVEDRYSFDAAVARYKTLFDSIG